MRMQYRVHPMRAEVPFSARPIAPIAPSRRYVTSQSKVDGAPGYRRISSATVTGRRSVRLWQ